MALGDQLAGAVRRTTEHAGDQHEGQQRLDDLHRSPPGKSASRTDRPGSGEAVPVSILKTRIPGIWLLCRAGGPLRTKMLRWLRSERQRRVRTPGARAWGARRG